MLTIQCHIGNSLGWAPSIHPGHRTTHTRPSGAERLCSWCCPAGGRISGSDPSNKRRASTSGLGWLLQALGPCGRILGAWHGQHADLYMYWYSTRVRLPPTNGDLTAAVSGDDHDGGAWHALTWHGLESCGGACWSHPCRLGQTRSRRHMSAVGSWQRPLVSPQSDVAEAGSSCSWRFEQDQQEHQCSLIPRVSPWEGLCCALTGVACLSLHA